MSPLRQVDTAVHASERKWGLHRLPLLVDQKTRQQWDAGWQQWITAIRADDQTEQARLAPMLVAALAWMDRQAAAEGCETAASVTWTPERPEAAQQAPRARRRHVA